MTALLPLDPASLARTAKNRIASAVFPKIYDVRARLPRYSLHEQARVFRHRAAERGLGDVSLYYWYHTVDLGNGLITPGTHDYRRRLDAFHFDEDMSGKTVLDVGSATGFFAFEFERRGAEVVSVEVPSVAAMDRFPNQAPEQLIEKIAAMTAGQSAYSPDEFHTVFSDASLDTFYRHFVDGPFQLCHTALGSTVQRRYATVYDIPKTDIGSMSFDIVFLGDLLLHALHPLSALAAVAPLCHGKLIIAQHMPAGLGSRPAALYVGGDAISHDHSTWWYPNVACFQQILMKLGFTEVKVVGRSTGVSRPGGNYYNRPVLHAVR